MIIIYSILDFVMGWIIAPLLINWWAPLFAYDGEATDRGVITKGPRLPNWLAWFDTFDATLDAGLKPGETSSYWTRMRWLYRNSAYGFSYWALGRPFDPSQWHVVAVRTSAPMNFEAFGPDDQFNHMFIWCGIEFKLGWKAWNYFDIDPQGIEAWKREPWGPEMRVPFVFSFSIAK